MEADERGTVVTEIAPGIHSLGHGKGGHVHAFLIDHGGELSLVDTLFESDGKLVFEAIRKLGKSPEDLKRIAITHGHRSHLGGMAALVRASGARLYAHEWEADIVCGDRRAQAVSIWPRQSLRLIPFQIGLWLDRPKHVRARSTNCSETATRSGRSKCCTRPATRPGHLAFWWPERRFLIAGDGVATWPELCPGWHSFNLNRPQHHATLQRLAALDAALVGVGHGDPITDGAQDKVHELASRPVP